METLIASALGAAAGLAGGLVAGAALLLVAAARPRRCADCHAPLPRFRLPATLRQALAGGWACPTCAAPCDRTGRKAE